MKDVVMHSRIEFYNKYWKETNSDIVDGATIRMSVTKGVYIGDNTMYKMMDTYMKAGYFKEEQHGTGV